jgi:phage terminase large subunit
MLAAVWVAVDTEHNAWVYKELYKPGLIVSEAAEELRWVNGTDVVEVKYAPPDLKNRQKDSGKSIFDLFSDAGEQLTESSNRRVDGWMAVKEWLKVRDTRDLETGEALKVPKMHVFENCKNLIRCLQAIAKDERDPNDCATEPHEVTHITDALRGFCVMRQCAADVPVEARVYDERTFEHAPVLGDHEYGEMDQSYVNY